MSKLVVKTLEEEKRFAKALNRLSREQLKYKILLDIQQDLAVCDLERWDKFEFLNEIETLVKEIKAGRAPILESKALCSS